jgi:hypothetical protein
MNATLQSTYTSDTRKAHTQSYVWSRADNSRVAVYGTCVYIYEHVRVLVSLGIGYVIHIQGLVNRQSFHKSLVGFLSKVLVCRSPHQRVLHQTICHTLSAPQTSLASHHKERTRCGEMHAHDPFEAPRISPSRLSLPPPPPFPSPPSSKPDQGHANSPRQSAPTAWCGAP